MNELNELKKIRELLFAIKSGVLTIEQEELIEQYKKLGINLYDYQNLESQSSEGGYGSSNSKQFVKKNGNKQWGNYEVDQKNGFSDIYMFGFLVLMFQSLFLILSYLLFK